MRFFDNDVNVLKATGPAGPVPEPLSAAPARHDGTLPSEDTE